MSRLTVQTRRSQRFRRCGIWFGPAPVIVETTALTPAQVDYLRRSTDVLDVIEMPEETPASSEEALGGDDVEGDAPSSPGRDVVEMPEETPASRRKRARR